MYSVPEEYQIRLHHIRPRFKADIENVLIYVASEIAKIEELPHSEFAESVRNAIRLYPGNTTATDKTIANWHTEISSLFGFIEYNGELSRCGRRAEELADNGDLVSFFKTFLYTFQYPGAHIKTHAISELITNGVKFKPAQYILSLLSEAGEHSGKRVGITKAETCWCIFNDLRVVRDNEPVLSTWQRISENRDNEIEYDNSGDKVRYAGDIIDYMVIANLLVTYDRKLYYLNTLENEAILKFINSDEWFSGYDALIETRNGDYEAINNCKDAWFSYVNRDLADTDFSTDVLNFIADGSTEHDDLVQLTRDAIYQLLEGGEGIPTKEIGDMGEGLIHSHECERIRLGGREDLVHLIKRIPTSLAMGYDIQSVEIDERKRYIEVKTTISLSPLSFNRVHLTTNEWAAARTLRDRYFIYRLMISKTEHKLYLIQDPVQKDKDDIIQMIPRDGADITFNPSTAGNYEELLSWKK